jgi:hypothetical protein
VASGRPRQPNDPSVMASVEAAMSTVARPRLIARMWHWRYELGLIAGVLLGTIGIGVTLGPGWLIAAAAAAMAVMAAALTWPPSRQRITARVTSGWPYLNRGDASSAEPEEPALYNGPG